MNLGEQQHTTGPVDGIRAGAESAKGLREENQDAMTRFLSRYGEVILVADGMGGHQGGATASDMVVKRYRLHLESMPPNMPLAEALQHAAAQINDEIHERGHSGDPAVAGMGSTLVLAVLTQSASGWDVTVANAGDSRAYLVRDGVLRQLTKDHTAVQRMIDAGILTEANARNHPNASVLTRALGQQPGVTVEVYPPVPLQGGDGLLLCSDGLSGYVVDSEISRVIAASPDPNGAVRSLVETALKSGSDDNITVQFLRLGEKALPAAVPVAMPLPPPPAAAASPRKTGRYIAIAAAILAAALAWPVGQLVAKWIRSKSDQPKVEDPKKTEKSTKPAGHKPADQKTNPASGQPPAANNPQDTPGGGVTPANPGGQPAPPSTTPGASGPARTPPAIEIHTPDKDKRPGWVDELKKNIPKGMKIGTLEVANLERDSTPFMPKTGIMIAFRPEFEQLLDDIENQIKNIKDLKEIKVHREQRKDLMPGVDILIVAAPDVYQRGVKPHR
jgi:serine/threonine protein phosphatase PrpC